MVGACLTDYSSRLQTDSLSGNGYKYGDQEVIIEIKTGTVKGRMSSRALRMLFEWAEIHQGELMEN